MKATALFPEDEEGAQNAEDTTDNGNYTNKHRRKVTKQNESRETRNLAAHIDNLRFDYNLANRLASGVKQVAVQYYKNRPTKGDIERLLPMVLWPEYACFSMFVASKIRV